MMLRLRDHDSRLRQSLSEGSPLVVPGTVRRDGRDAALRFGCAAVRIRSDRPAADCGISWPTVMREPADLNPLLDRIDAGTDLSHESRHKLARFW